MNAYLLRSCLIKQFSIRALLHNIMRSCICISLLSTTLFPSSGRAQSPILSRIHSASVTGDKVSIIFSCTTSKPEFKRPLLTLNILRDDAKGSISVTTYIMTSLPDIFWHPGWYANNELLKLSGFNDSYVPTNEQELSKLLCAASKNTVPVLSKHFKRLNIQSSPPIQAGKTLGVHVDIWIDGVISTSYNDINRNELLRRNIPADWYAYAKYPDRFLYTSFQSKGYGPIRIRQTSDNLDLISRQPSEYYAKAYAKDNISFFTNDDMGAIAVRIKNTDKFIKLYDADSVSLVGPENMGVTTVPAGKGKVIKVFRKENLNLLGPDNIGATPINLDQIILDDF